MKILLINPVSSNDPIPYHLPVELGIMTRIAEQMGELVAILDLNVSRLTADQVQREFNEQAQHNDAWDVIVFVDRECGCYKEIKTLAPICRKIFPRAVIIMAGDIATIFPSEMMYLIPDLDILIRDRTYQAWKDLIKGIPLGQWSRILGVVHRDKTSVLVNENPIEPFKPDSLPFPAYDLISLEPSDPRVTGGLVAGYFLHSSLPFSPASNMSRKRASVKWTHRDNDGKLVRNSPRYAINNVMHLRIKHAVDFVSILDTSLTSDVKWLAEFTDLYEESGLNTGVRWSCNVDIKDFVDDQSVLRYLMNASCAFVHIRLESGSERILEQINAGHTAAQAEKVIELLIQKRMPYVPMFSIGRKGESMDDILETLHFAQRISAPCIPAIHMPKYDSEEFKERKDELYRYEDIQSWGVTITQVDEVRALDRFLISMLELDPVSVAVSDIWSRSELMALQVLCAKGDIVRLLKYSHLSATYPKESGRIHGNKWNKECVWCQGYKLAPATSEARTHGKKQTIEGKA